jgi:hypothetical protein
VAKVSPNALVGSLSGTLGNAVLVRRGDGSVVVRQRVWPRDPASPAQLAVRGFQARARQEWQGLSAAQQEAWRRFAEGPGRGDGPRPPRADLLYLKLSTKRWQVDPSLPPLAGPPEAAFLGDAVVVTAEGAAGAVRFTASGPNQPGVATELLLAPVRSWLARPNANAFRSRGFAAFAGSSLSVDVPARPGRHACAARFVLVGTGQSSALVRLGVVEVGG